LIDWQKQEIGKARPEKRRHFAAKRWGPSTAAPL